MRGTGYLRVTLSSNPSEIGRLESTLSPAPPNLNHTVVTGQIWRQKLRPNVWQPRKARPSFLAVVDSNPYQLFADRRDGKIPNEAEYGAKSTMTSVFGRLATFSGKELNWDNAINSDISLWNVDALIGMNDEAPVQPNADGSYPCPRSGAGAKDVIDWEVGIKKKKKIRSSLLTNIKANQRPAL